MFVLRNRHAPEPSEANSNARLSGSKQLLKNIHSVMVASFCSLKKTYLPPLQPKTHRMTDCRLYEYQSTKKARRRDKTPAQRPVSATAHKAINDIKFSHNFARLSSKFVIK